MPSISVIIPCYNRETLVGETISNMLQQTLPALEIIVVDDGSTDNSADVIRSFGGKVKLIQQTNQGPGSARNAGFKASSGEYIQFMDSDDLASLNKFEVQVNALEKTGADFAYCSWVRSIIENKTVQFTDSVLQSKAVPNTRPMLEWFLTGWSLVFQNCLFRRSILEKAGTYRTDLMPSEDSEYFVRILLAGAKPVFTPECLVFYREHNHGKITASGTSVKQRINDWTHYLEITGNNLSERLDKFSPYTKLLLAANVAAHLEYCKKHQLPGLPKGHPYLSLISPVSKPVYAFLGIYRRIQRRLKRTADTHPAFNSGPVSDKHKKHVENMQYRVIGS
jgi:glycosyltransferase involved in cell wall biosynthesis